MNVDEYISLKKKIHMNGRVDFIVIKTLDPSLKSFIKKHLTSKGFLSIDLIPEKSFLALSGSLSHLNKNTITYSNLGNLESRVYCDEMFWISPQEALELEPIR